MHSFLLSDHSDHSELIKSIERLVICGSILLSDHFDYSEIIKLTQRLSLDAIRSFRTH